MRLCRAFMMIKGIEVMLTFLNVGASATAAGRCERSSYQLNCSIVLL